MTKALLVACCFLSAPNAGADLSAAQRSRDYTLDTPQKPADAFQSAKKWAVANLMAEAGSKIIEENKRGLKIVIKGSAARADWDTRVPLIATIMVKTGKVRMLIEQVGDQSYPKTADEMKKIETDYLEPLRIQLSDAIVGNTPSKEW